MRIGVGAAGRPYPGQQRGPGKVRQPVDVGLPSLGGQGGPGVVEGGAAAEHHEPPVRVARGELAGRFGVQLQGIAENAPVPRLRVVDRAYPAASAAAVRAGVADTSGRS